MAQKRPFGITILGVTDLIVGLIGSVAVFIYGLWAFSYYLLRYIFRVEVFRPLRFIFLSFSEAICLSLFLSGIWLLKLRREARVLFLFLSPLIGAVLFYGIYKGFLFMGSSEKLASQTSVLLTSTFLIINISYLNLPKVKEQLKEMISERAWSSGIYVFGLSLLYFPIRGLERFPRHLSYSWSVTLSELYPNPPVHFLLLIISIIAIFGIFAKRKWAYYFLAAFTLFHLLWAVPGLVKSSINYISALDLGVLLNMKVALIKFYYFVALIYFFTRPQVRQQFK